jgi:hypothetical protein
MSTEPEVFSGSTERLPEDQKTLAGALNAAANDYFEKHPDQKGHTVRFRLKNLEVTASHNPIHDYFADLTTGP